MKSWLKRSVIIMLLASGLLAVSADQAEARHRRWRRCCRPVCVSHCHTSHSNCCHNSYGHGSSYAGSNCCTTGHGGYGYTGYSAY